MEVLLSGFLRDENATTAIEYAIIVAGIALAIVAAIQALGSVVFGWFTTLQAMP